MIWGWLIPGWLKRAAFGLAAVGLALLAAFGMGKREGHGDAKVKNLEEDRDANRRMDKADISSGDATADAEWLRKRSGK